MTLVRFNNRPAKSFNNLVDDFFTGMPSIFSEGFLPAGNRFSVPANVTETETGYVLELVAPGFEKEELTVNLDNNIMTVSGEKKSEQEKTEGRSIRKEFRHQSFKRSFTVDENIDAQNIVAKYVNGVLTLNLPKKAEVKEAAKQINVQ